MPAQSTRKRQPAEIRFWSFVDKNGPIPAHRPELGPCWVWIGGKHERGYGLFKVHPKTFRAHRWSYEQSNGPIPDGLLVCHECDKPPCVNPAHLSTGTQKKNLADMTERGRAPDHAVNAHFLDNGRIVLAEHPERRARGEGHGNAKLTADDVRAIRRRYAEGDISQTALAREYGVYQSTIDQIVNRKTWKHVA